MKLYNIFESLILEFASRDQINDAINNRVRVNIHYAGDDNTASGQRTIEVYAYGLTKSGNQAIRAYQIFGNTKTIIPQWKIFRVDRITRWEPLNFKFYTPISDRDPTIPAFNPTGDKSMTTIYNIVKF
jgi:hypothetical protein